MQQLPRGRNLFVSVVVGLILLVSIGGFVYARHFKSFGSAADLLPADSGLLLSFVANSKNKSVQQFKDKYEAFGGKRLLGTSVARAVRDSFSMTDLDYASDIEPWIGDEIVVAKTSQSADAKLVVLAQVRDIVAAIDSLAKIESSVKAIDRSAQTVTYRGVLYSAITLPGKTDIYVTYVRGYVVAAFSSQDIERIIDVAKHRARSLSAFSEYKQVKKESAKAGRLSAAMMTLYAKFGADAAPFGGGLIADEKGLRVQFVQLPGAGAGSDLNRGGFEPHAFAQAPVDASVVVEALSIESFMKTFYSLYQQIKSLDAPFDKVAADIDAAAKLSVKDAFFALGNDRATLALLSRVTEQMLDIGFILESRDANDADINAHIAVLEKYALQHAKRDTGFQKTDFKGVAMHSVHIEDLGMELSYTVLDKKVLIANSPQALRTLIETVTGIRGSLSANDKAKSNFDALGLKRVDSFFYLDSDALLQTIFAADDTSDLLAENGKDTTQITRLLLQLFTHGIMASAPEKSGDLFSGYLLMK